MIRRLNLLIALVATLAAPAHAGVEGAPVVTVVLPAEAEVSGTSLRLDDVASVLTADPALAAAVAATDLGYAPAPGYSRLLQNHQIGAELQRAHPHVAWVFKGERATRVWPAVERIAGDRLLEAASNALRLAARGRDIEFESAAPVTELVIPRSAAGARLEVEPQDARLTSGRLSVPVIVRLDGQAYRRVNTVWNVRVFQTLPVLVRSVVPGEVLSESLFETRRVLLDNLVGANPLPLASLRGATAARKLEANQPVNEQDIHRPVVIRAGEDLMVEIAKGAVSARVMGLAIGSGAVGDRISVRLVDTGREMLATVVSSEMARVELGR